METKDINALNANAKNPRKINKHDYEKLVQSIRVFGDLSGIVFNTRTNQLVGGHQRIQAFKQLGGQPHITERFAQANSVGTVALGYVLLGDERYTYREVDWTAEHEKAANVAANRIQGEFDLDLLAEITYEISQAENASELLNLTGQTNDELERLLKMSGAIEEPTNDNEDDGEKLEFRLTSEQREVVEEALGHIKATREMQAISNASVNGAALFAMCQDYLLQLHHAQDAHDASAA